MPAFQTTSRLHAVLACWIATATPAAAQPAWTRLAPVYALAGGGDILAAATAGGVVFWDLPNPAAREITTAHGLPTQLILDASLSPDRDLLCLATSNGLARGWLEAGWSSWGARSDERGLATYSCAAWSGGGCLAGGDNGLLVLWGRERADSLQVPTRSGRVVALGLFTSWIDGGAERDAVTLAGAGPPRAQHSGQPVFPVGLVAATDNDGVWLLRASGSVTRWLRFVQEDGLPSHRTRAVLTDDRGRLWVGTDAGVAWIGADLRVRSFPADSLLSQRVHALHVAFDGFLYVGLERGLARLDPAALESSATLVQHTERPVVALASTAGALWWSDGEVVASLAGARLEAPVSVAANHGLALAMVRDSLWVGHPGGKASVWFDASWGQLGSANGLPSADVLSFLRVGERFYVGTAGAGLFERTAMSSPGLPRLVTAPPKARRAQPHFAPVAGAPAHVAAQAFAQGLHWLGGDSGLYVQRGAGWEQVALWSGAFQVADLLAVHDTLWVSAAHAGVGYHDGQDWIVLPRSADLVGAFCGDLGRSAAGRLAVATDRGAATWSNGILCREPGFPGSFVTAVTWWDEMLACGTHRGLWLRDPSGAWSTLGVLEGLPGAQIRALTADAAGTLWVGTTRGLGRLIHHSPAGGTPWLPASGRTLEPRGQGDDDQPTGGWLRVYDVRGRLLRRLEPGSAWDNRDTHGRRLPRGVYFLRPERSPLATTRVVVLQ